MVVKEQLLCVEYLASLTTCHTGDPNIPFDILILKIFLCESDILPVIFAHYWRILWFCLKMQY